MTGATALNGGLTMDTNKFVVEKVTGNTTIAGTLRVTGDTTLAGALNVNSIVPIGDILSLGSIAPFSTMNIGTEVKTINIGTETSGTINIGKTGSKINLLGNVNNNNITNLDIENKNIFLNGNAKALVQQHMLVFISKMVTMNRKHTLLHLEQEQDIY